MAITTSVLLARNLARPIEAIQVAAAKIGSGSLDQRIDASSHDELGALADEFNHMAAQLQASHADLEQQVEERTRELASALAELDEKTRELEAASRHKSEFLANMSHELRTPLNAISGFSQVLRKQLFGEINDKQAEYLDDILDSSRHLQLLIDDVLDLSKVEAGQIDLQVAPFSLPEALERGVVIVRERATRGGVRVSLSSEPGVETVVGDERRIVQVIFNLLSNAVKFTPAGRDRRCRRGAVRWRGARFGHRHRTGHRPGGPGQDLRGVPAGRRGQGAIRGDGPRIGAVETPRRAARRTDLGRQRTRKGQHLRVHAPGPTRVAMARKQILVVEDNEKNMKLFRDVLQATGYQTLEASTAGQALALASEHRPALVLMDIQLPDMDGLEALAGCGRTSAPPPSRCSP